MDADTIQKIAEETAKHVPQLPWLLLLIQAVLIVAGAGIGAYFSEYLKTKVKNLATKEDFEALKLQLRENTELVENIKADVGQRDWAAREWKNLRRTKLEEVLTKMHDCEEYEDRYRHDCIDAKPSVERDPVGEMENLAALYLPELRSEVTTYVMAHREHKRAGANLSAKLIEAGSDGPARQAHYAIYMNDFDERTAASRTSQYKLNEAARRLIVEIAGVDGK